MFKQLIVFVENRPGRLEEVTGCLADEQINLHALTIADTTDFGILRMIVSDPDKAERALKAKGFMVKTTDVVAVAMGHDPGSLHQVLRTLRMMDISIEYIYAFTSRPTAYGAIVVLRLENQDAALDKLKGADIQLLGPDFLHCLNEV